MQHVGQERLFITEGATRVCLRRAELLQDVGMRTQFETIDRRVTGHTPWALPVMDNQEFARIFKEGINLVGDHDVNIEK